MQIDQKWNKKWKRILDKIINIIITHSLREFEEQQTDY